MNLARLGFLVSACVFVAGTGSLGREVVIRELFEIEDQCDLQVDLHPRDIMNMIQLLLQEGFGFSPL